jgi:hypothetical protein
MHRPSGSGVWFGSRKATEPWSTSLHRCANGIEGVTGDQDWETDALRWIRFEGDSSRGHLSRQPSEARAGASEKADPGDGQRCVMLGFAAEAARRYQDGRSLR